jgi:phosphoserine phosphatase RsbU/P
VNVVSAWHECVTTLLRDSRVVQPSGLPELINEALRPVRVEATVYLVDREQVALRALPRAGRATPEPLAVDATVAGRAYMTQEVVVPPGQSDRMWLPLVNDTERLGAIELQLPADLSPEDPQVRAGAVVFALALGDLIIGKLPYGDAISRTRRSQPMSTEGEMLWRTLPPLTCTTSEVTVAAVLEPCYDVGGDAFDYAVDYQHLRVAIVDAVGHGLTAALTCTLTLAATRAARTAGLGIAATAAAADTAITSQFQDSRYATAILAELNTITGLVRYINAGHPPAVLMREGRIVASLEAAPRTPLGLPEPSRIAEYELQPGDRLMFYTDGIVDARDADGQFFGIERLVDAAERHTASGLPAPETLRRLARAVVDHQEGTLQDDATLLIVDWHPGNR